MQSRVVVFFISFLSMMVATAHAEGGFFDKLKKSVTGDYTVRGRVQVHSGEWLTCFNGINTGYLGSANLARPGDAQIDPATGKMTVTTAAIPSVIMTLDGTVTSNDCDSLDKQHLLVLVMPAEGGAGVAQSDTGYLDPYGCTNPEWTKNEVVARGREIMQCQSEVMTDIADARYRARSRGEDPAAAEAAVRGGGYPKRGQAIAAQGATTGGDHSSGIRSKYRDAYDVGCVTEDMSEEYILAHTREIHECQSDRISDRAWNRAQAGNSGGATGTAAAGSAEADRQAAVAKLQQDTAEKFKAIQSQGATPTAAPAQSDEDLAWDGAKLCGLKPAYMMKMKEEAVRFVRIDNASDRIVLSEMAGGARKEVAVDGSTFAQRASFNAQAIGQGGDTCARAFWNTEAYKAASAAMSGR